MHTKLAHSVDYKKDQLWKKYIFYTVAWWLFPDYRRASAAVYRDIVIYSVDIARNFLGRQVTSGRHFLAPHRAAVLSPSVGSSLRERSTFMYTHARRITFTTCVYIHSHVRVCVGDRQITPTIYNDVTNTHTQNIDTTFIRYLTESIVCTISFNYI